MKCFKKQRTSNNKETNFETNKKKVLGRRREENTLAADAWLEEFLGNGQNKKQAMTEIVDTKILVQGETVDKEKLMSSNKDSNNEAIVKVDIKMGFRYPAYKDEKHPAMYNCKIERNVVEFPAITTLIMERCIHFAAEEIAMIMWCRNPPDVPFNYLASFDQVKEVLRSYMAEGKFLNMEHFKLFLFTNDENLKENSCSLCDENKKNATSFQDHFQAKHLIMSLNIKCKKRKCNVVLTHPCQAYLHMLDCAKVDISETWDGIPWLLLDSMRDFVGNRDDASNKCFLVQPGLPCLVSKAKRSEIRNQREQKTEGMSDDREMLDENLVVKNLLPEMVQMVGNCKLIDTVTYTAFMKKEDQIKEHREKQKASRKEQRKEKQSFKRNDVETISEEVESTNGADTKEETVHVQTPSPKKKRRQKNKPAVVFPNLQCTEAEQQLHIDPVHSTTTVVENVEKTQETTRYPRRTRRQKNETALPNLPCSDKREHLKSTSATLVRPLQNANEIPPACDRKRKLINKSAAVNVDCDDEREQYANVSPTPLESEIPPARKRKSNMEDLDAVVSRLKKSVAKDSGTVEHLEDKKSDLEEDSRGQCEKDGVHKKECGANSSTSKNKAKPSIVQKRHENSPLLVSDSSNPTNELPKKILIILNERNITGIQEFKVKWMWFSDAYDQWLEVTQLDCPQLIKDFKDRREKLAKHLANPKTEPEIVNVPILVDGFRKQPFPINPMYKVKWLLNPSDKYDDWQTEAYVKKFPDLI